MFVGDKYTFRWYTGKHPGTTSLYLSRDNGVTYSETPLVVKDNVEDQDTVLEYEWTITGPAATQCKVKIVDSFDGQEIIGDAFEISENSLISMQQNISIGMSL